MFLKLYFVFKTNQIHCFSKWFQRAGFYSKGLDYLLFELNMCMSYLLQNCTSAKSANAIKKI